jgi:N-acyl-D-aspartate/D-glutamate deacylase
MIERAFAALSEGSLAGFTEEHIKQMKRIQRRMGEGGESGMSADERALNHTFGKIGQVVDSCKPGALSAFLLLVCLA